MAATITVGAALVLVAVVIALTILRRVWTAERVVPAENDLVSERW